MTESAFPFEATAEEPAETAGTDKRKRLLLAGAAVLAVAVVGNFAVRPMLSGGSSTEAVSVVKHATPKKTAKKATAAKPAAKPVAQPKTYPDVYARTDPFAPLVRPPVVAAPAAPAAAPGSTTTGGTTGTTGSTTGTTSGSSASVGGQRVALVHVYTKDGKSYAQTKVGDTVFTPVVGSVFGGSYKLLATSGKTATYLFGDEQFSLSEGQEVLK
jgi:hypothetical protein